MKISFSIQFIKSAKKLDEKQRKQLKSRLAIFVENPTNKLLNNHQLKGAQKDYRSITVSGDLRALYFEIDDEIIFDIVGTHSQLYR
jgi:addiction module RelE/StbE family toxin